MAEREPMSGDMKTRTLFSLVLLGVGFGLAAAPALAQVTPWSPYGSPYATAGAAGGDVQRYRMEQQRQQAEYSAALAQQQALQTRLTLMELQARRLPAPPVERPDPALRPLEQERAAREAATRRRQSTAQGVSEIDAWLDRQPH